jgi:hypothetical protein
MMWILSLFGIGGFGAALFFVPGLAARVLNLLGIVVDWFAGHPWAIAMLACIAFGLIRDQEAVKWQRVAHSTEVALNQRTESLGITVQSLEALTKTVRAQTTMIRGWTKVADQRQNAAQDALRAAQVRGAAAETLAQQIDRERLQRGSVRSACATSESVMNARGAF